MQSILVVDDDPAIRDIVSRYLTKSGFQVTAVADGKSMFQRLKDGDVDLIVLDLTFPDENGLDMAAEIRRSSNIPIIMLTGKSEEVDRVVGLELGADDYMPKPFSPRELLARIRTVLRRTVMSRDETRKIGEHRKTATFNGWNMNVSSRELFTPGGDRVDLTTGEFDLLGIFVSHPQRVMGRDRLLDMVGREDTFDRSVDVRILRLRRKLEADPQAPRIIKTVRGVGYVFVPRVEWS